MASGATDFSIQAVKWIYAHDASALLAATAGITGARAQPHLQTAALSPTMLAAGAALTPRPGSGGGASIRSGRPAGGSSRWCGRPEAGLP